MVDNDQWGEFGFQGPWRKLSGGFGYRGERSATYRARRQSWGPGVAWWDPRFPTHGLTAWAVYAFIPAEDPKVGSWAHNARYRVCELDELGHRVCSYMWIDQRLYPNEFVRLEQFSGQRFTTWRSGQRQIEVQLQDCSMCGEHVWTVADATLFVPEDECIP
jgi:hypothetical protein